MKAITANFSATSKTVKGKVWKTQAHTMTFSQDENGTWFGKWGSALECDVIEDCKRATNWAEIKAAHFPMVGFHS